MKPPILKSKRFVLKPYEKTDEERFVEMALDALSVQFMGGANGIEAEERVLFAKCLELYNREMERWFWVWGVYEQDRLCAHLELKESQFTLEGELEVVYMVHPNERRRGVMTEALNLLKANKTKWKRKITATISPQNTNSMSLLKKWGIEKKELIKEPETGESFLKLTLS